MLKDARRIEIPLVSDSHSYTMQKFRGDNYSEVVQATSKFNARLCRQRRSRVPFLDAQTGVAQKGGVLYKKKWQRKKGGLSGVLFTYTAPRWRNQNAFNIYAVPTHGAGLMMALSHGGAGGVSGTGDSSDFFDAGPNLNGGGGAGNGAGGAKTTAGTGVVFHDENSTLS